MLALASAGLLILAFPPFDLWFLAWFALVPLLLAIEREKASTARSFFLGWAFGTVFFFGTCWWLTFAPITYAGFPAPLAYLLLFVVTSVAGAFTGLFGLLVSVFLRSLNSFAVLVIPFVWVFSEFLRYWITGNSWNAIAYSQAFNLENLSLAAWASVGGIHLIGFELLVANSFIFTAIILFKNKENLLLRNYLYSFTLFFNPILGLAFLIAERRAHNAETAGTSIWKRIAVWYLPAIGFLFLPLGVFLLGSTRTYYDDFIKPKPSAYVVAVQPNVPMSGLDIKKWQQLRERQSRLAENALSSSVSSLAEHQLKTYLPENQDPEDERFFRELYTNRFRDGLKVVILPESPMNFMYEDDAETKEFINGFAARNNVSVLFNSAEPDAANGKYFNSAVLVGPEGREVAQYDKIYLLPFGEAVPFPLEAFVPGFVGNFSYGKEYDLLPLGNAKAGVMICFESHFGQLSREYARNGADVIIEMTNDGYLGPTPVLRQHLANAVFRAVETNRPVLRVTNVGITAYINERGEVSDAAEPYTEATRVWSVAKSDGSQTFYVKYGDWFAWLSTLLTMGTLIFAFWRARAGRGAVSE